MGSIDEPDSSDLQYWVQGFEWNDAKYDELVTRLRRAQEAIEHHPYCLPLYITLAKTYLFLAYPDLAAGAAYKALLLSDAVQDESDEYHEVAVESLTESTTHVQSKDESQNHASQNDDSDEAGGTGRLTTLIREQYLIEIYRTLIDALGSCGSYKSAANYYSQATALYSDDSSLALSFDRVRSAVAKYFDTPVEEVNHGEHSNTGDWPDHGLVRRENYPWNHHEPDRLAKLDELNEMMSVVAPKLEVQVVDLPLLAQNGEKGIVKQLGVFAKEDVAPDQIVLDERSILTANNRLQDALCDACSSELPGLNSPEAEATMSCPDCEVVFCSQRCYNDAMAGYHPSLCDMAIEAISKDVSPAEAPNALYALLLLRSFAMAQTQNCHPLDLKEVKWLWGDFRSLRPTEHWKPSLDELPSSSMPKTLPFSFEYNIRLPFHMLEKMDIDIFTNTQYDVWVFNMLYAKFRGTASARLSGQASTASRGPEVAAVHPMWCLGNHSCDPNVSWEWGGGIKFWVMHPRATWERENGEMHWNKAGIKKGEELLNHYCDIDLPVKQRREWLRGTLGGDCQCARCIWEANEGG